MNSNDPKYFPQIILLFTTLSVRRVLCWAPDRRFFRYLCLLLVLQESCKPNRQLLEEAYLTAFEDVLIFPQTVRTCLNTTVELIRGK